MNNLIDVFNEFWIAWFGSNLNVEILGFIVITSVISLVYGVILRPLFSLFSR